VNGPTPSLVWRFYSFLAYRHGFLQLSLVAAALVGAYRVLTHQPLFGGLFDFVLGLAAGALILTLLVALASRSKAP
jgi:hypothetical protein